MKISPLLILTVILCGVAKTASAGDVKVDVNLSPAGSFVAQTAKVKGSAYKTQNGVAAKDVVIDLNSLTTGVGLRDKHLKERLQTSKFPMAKLSAAVGKNGQGKAIIEIKGQKKKVDGKYTVEGSNLNAEFNLKLSDLGINDINYMGVGVDDNVVVHISLPIQSDRATASVEKKK